MRRNANCKFSSRPATNAQKLSFFHEIRKFYLNQLANFRVIVGVDSFGFEIPQNIDPSQNLTSRAALLDILTLKRNRRCQFGPIGNPFCRNRGPVPMMKSPAITIRD